MRSRHAGAVEGSKTSTGFGGGGATREDVALFKKHVAPHVKIKAAGGIADLNDLTDRNHGLRLVIGIKTGFDPNAVLEQLYRLTPLEDSFGINNVALVDGQGEGGGSGHDALAAAGRRRAVPRRSSPACGS